MNHVINGPVNVPENASDLATACVLCSHNCGLRVDVAGNEIVKIRADESNPITHGYSCNKGYSINFYVKHAQRTEYPMKKKPDGTFERISWEQAASEIGAKLNAIRKNHPGRSIALCGVGGQGNHMDGPYAIPFLLGLGSNIIFNALAQEKTQHALVDKWVFKSSPSAFLHSDAERSDYVLMMGTNPVLSNRGHNATEFIKEIKDSGHRKLVVVDPKETETAKRAHRHVRVKPGGDVYLLMGLASYMIREDLVNRKFIAEKTSGFDKLSEALKAADPAEMARRAGLEPSELATIAREFATAKSASIFNDLGIEQTPHSTLISYLIRVITLITGNVGNDGGNVFHPLYGPKTPPATRQQAKALESGIEAIPMMFPFGIFSPNLLPEEILSSHPDRIRAVIVEGSNPLVSFSDSTRYREAFGKLDLLVVIDPAFTETAQIADYVLPTPTGYEKWEYSGFPKLYPEVSAQLRPPVLKGPAEALPEAEIYHRIAKSMGMVEEAPAPLKVMAKFARNPLVAPVYMAALTAAAAIKARDIKKTTARVMFWLYETLGPTLPSPVLAAFWMITQSYALTRRDEIARVWPETKKMLNPFAVGEFLFQKLLDHPEGVIVGKIDKSRNFADNCNHEDGRAHLLPAELVQELRDVATRPEADHSDYPFVLDGGMRTNWNANTVHRNPAWRKGKGPHCNVIIHPDDAKAAGIQTGGQVRIETRRGSATAPALLDPSTRRGHIHVPNGFGLDYPDPVTGELKRTGVRVNELTDAMDRDPFTGCPNHKMIRCRVSPVEVAAS